MSTLPDVDSVSAAAHVQRATAETARIPDIAADTPIRPVRRVAVIGAGTMGGGIAMALVQIGIPVTLIDASAQGLERGLQRRSEEHTSELQSRFDLVCRLL